MSRLDPDFGMTPIAAAGRASSATWPVEQTSRPAEQRRRAKRRALGSLVEGHGMEREELPAVYDSDLESVLDKLGILEALEQGNMKCGICGEPVSMDTIGCIFAKDGRVQLCCANPACLRHFTRARSEGACDE